MHDLTFQEYGDLCVVAVDRSPLVYLLRHAAIVSHVALRGKGFVLLDLSKEVDMILRDLARKGEQQSIVDESVFHGQLSSAQ